MSSGFNAILAYLLDQDWAKDPVVDLAVTGDGALIAAMLTSPVEYVTIGTEQDLWQNLDGVAGPANLSADEYRQLMDLARQKLRYQGSSTGPVPTNHRSLLSSEAVGYPSMSVALWQDGVRSTSLDVRPDHFATVGSVADIAWLLCSRLLERGQKNGQMRQWAEAMADFDAAAVLSPFNSDFRAVVHSNRAWALAHLGHGEAALDAADQSLALHTDQRLEPRLRLNRALALGKLGRHAEALVDEESGLRASPHDPELHYDRACSLACLGRFAEALDALDAAIRLDPTKASLAVDDEDLQALSQASSSRARFRDLTSRAAH